MQNADEFGSYLRAARHVADVSQRELATNAGVAPSTLGRIEAGTNVPRLGLALRLLAATGHGLAVVNDVTGEPLMLMGTDNLTDAAGRRFPAHCDVRPVGPGFREWWGDLGYTGRKRPTHTFDLSREYREWRRRSAPESLLGATVGGARTEQEESEDGDRRDETGQQQEGVPPGH
jgi:transcriptional regulator with XRE-family HTH domain